MAMNIFKNNRIVFWILIFLVVVNIATLATFFIFTRKVPSEAVTGGGPGKGYALRQELSLEPDQSLKVNAINEAYEALSEPIVKAIREKKADLLEELSNDETDTNLVIKLADDIVIEQKKLQMANVKQFLDLKKVCTPEQTKKLSRIYSEMYGCENKGGDRGQGNGQGKGYRHRYGQKNDSAQ